LNVADELLDDRRLSEETIMAEAVDLGSRWQKMNAEERRRIVELLVKTVAGVAAARTRVPGGMISYEERKKVRLRRRGSRSASARHC
jgi:hypothetical protein